VTVRTQRERKGERGKEEERERGRKRKRERNRRNSDSNRNIPTTTNPLSQHSSQLVARRPLVRIHYATGAAAACLSIALLDEVRQVLQGAVLSFETLLHNHWQAKKGVQGCEIVGEGRDGKR
jgi:hypothetical protein